MRAAVGTRRRARAADTREQAPSARAPLCSVCGLRGCWSGVDLLVSAIYSSPVMCDLGLSTFAPKGRALCAAPVATARALGPTIAFVLTEVILESGAADVAAR